MVSFGLVSRKEAEKVRRKDLDLKCSFHLRLNSFAVLLERLFATIGL